MSKTILVTGASSGIGLALCKLLLSDTDSVIYGLDMDPWPGPPDDGRYNHILCDLRKAKDLKCAVESSGLTAGRLDAIVNCAGVMPTSLVARIDPEQALDAFSVNCVAPIYLGKLLVKSLARARSSNIVLVTSIAADVSIPGEVIYGATKAALKHIGEAMSVELARFGVRVNSVAPALVRTPMTAHLSSEQRQYMQKKQALVDSISPEDVASVVMNLINSLNVVTSSTLYVGGIAK